MLFAIDESIADVIRHVEQPDESIIIALSVLAHAYRRGIHLVTASADTLRVIRGCEQLQECDRSIYQRILDDWPMMAGLSKCLTRRIVIVATGNVFRMDETGSGITITLSAAFISGSAIAEKTIFLAENLDDIPLYQFIAYAYQQYSGLGQIRLHFTPVNGGGSTTAPQYQSILSERDYLCLCIADVDRKYPNGAMGDTARRLKRVKDQNPDYPLCEQIILKVREAENLISNQMLSELIASDPQLKHPVSFLQNIETSPLPEARNYFDMKSGLRLAEIIGQNAHPMFSQYWSQTLQAVNVEVGKCWTNAQCTGKSNCSCVIPGLGPAILERVCTQVLAQQSSEATNQMVNGQLRIEWNEIGEIITAWFCGGDRLRSA